MIVKNESHVITNTFDNLCKYITFDYWVICDTGSTDGTQELIKTYFANKGIPGELVQHEWKDFGHNRSLALAASYDKADYVLIFDADDTIHGDFKLPSPFDQDGYMVKFGDGFTYLRPQLINCRKKWKYVGVLHEFLAPMEPVRQNAVLEGNYFIDSGKTGDRSRDPNKYLKDANILKEAFFKEKEAGNDLANRYAFYCAQSYKDCNRIDDAIEWYTRVVEELANWTQEKYFSCLMLGQFYNARQDFEKSIHYLMKSITFDSERIEGIVLACDILRQKKIYHIVVALYEKYKNYNPNPEGKLFLTRDYYESMFEFNASACAGYIGEKQLSYDTAKKVTCNPKAVDQIRKICLSNFRQFGSQINNDNDTLDLFYAFNDYVQETDEKENIIIWNILFNKNKDKLTSYSLYKPKTKNQEILLTMTSCKRFDLFQQTVNSVLNHFLDKERIGLWFCVDDNSSEEDRQLMKKKYPCFEYYFKTSKEKGHRESMNIIWNKLNEVKPKYWIHIEDDFLFHCKKNYITESIKFLESQTDIKQVLFNRNYAETIDDVVMRGAVPVSPGFLVHEQKSGSFPYLNCHYWPHYSFRPGVIDASVILKLGNFDSPNTFFEMDYANKWTLSGYKTGFFDSILCRHIGRLTKDRNSDKIKNAYDLNEESQFTKVNPEIKIINLKRRIDRRQKIENEFKELKYQIVPAIDGKQLVESEIIYKIFKGNDFNYRRGIIGCALSHYELWKALVEDKNHDYYIIVEDDINLCKDFSKKLDSIREDLKTKECVFLGYSMFQYNRKNTAENYINDNYPTVCELNKNFYMGGTFLYSINKKGASELLKYIGENGIKHGIDYVMKISGVNLYETQPQLAFSEVYDTPLSTTDTDIQNNYECLDYGFIDQYEFKQGLDQFGNDIGHNLSIFENMKKGLSDPNIVAFNTLGFIKNKIQNLAPSPYFGANDGIYIKKVKKTKLKMLCNWQSSEDLVKEWSLMKVPSNIEFTTENPDYYVVINYPPPNEGFDPLKTVWYFMEPKAFSDKINIDKTKFLHVNDHSNYLNAVQYNFPIRTPPEIKLEKVCSILSSKYSDIGHKLRVDFIKQTEELFEVYGKENSHSLSSYKGPVPEENRSNVYLNYKYCLAVENNSEYNYVTEKIWEPILCETLAFYWGCPNLEDHIDPQSFVRLPIEDTDKAKSIIQQAIKEDWWSQRIDSIRATKELILTKLAFFPRLNTLLNQKINVYICGCVKNCAKYLTYVMNNVQLIASQFPRYEIVIAYDDSSDNSLDILNAYKSKLNLTILHNSNKSNFTTQNIAGARNSIMNYLKDKIYDYFIMMDFDDVCSKQINLNVLKNTLKRDDWDAVSFNRPGYYDIWALSIDQYQNSCWHYEGESIKRTEETRRYVINKLKNTPIGTLVECQSAFNGFAIYRRGKFDGCEYKWNISDSNKYVEAPPDRTKQEDCEHRTFHMEATKKHGARIRISPEDIFNNDTNQETDCDFVSSRGMLKACDIKSKTPVSSIGSLVNYNFKDVKHGSIVYICGTALREFVNAVLPYKVVLVTGDCDWTLPTDVFPNKQEFLNFIESDRIIHWFSQNCVVNHPKMTRIPIGMDYHTMSLSNHEWGSKLSPYMQEQQLISLNTEPFWNRGLKCYANFHFSMNTRFAQDRRDALENIPKILVEYEETKVPRYESWKKQVQYTYVISPHGGGLDCHRTWEALCLGCVPIVKSSNLDPLFEDLPVLIVKDWKEVTFNLLFKARQEMSKKKYNYEKLKLGYWVRQFRVVAQSSL